MAKKEIKKKSKIEKDKEIFEVKKKGKEKTIVKETTNEIPSGGKKQVEQNNKILRNILIGIFLFALIFVALYFYFSSLGNFEYRGMEINTIKQGEITFYQTAFPIMKNNQKIDYNVYLRNDPRKLESTVPFNGNFSLKQIIVINFTGDLNCNGYGSISVANIMGVQTSVGGKVIRDPNATCDSEGRYTFFQINEANKTEVTQIGKSCYRIDVANCEVLPATERVLYKMIERINEMIKAI